MKQKELIEKYWFLHSPIECNDGWLSLLNSMCEEISAVIESKYPAFKYLEYPFEFSQIKEKYGCYDNTTEVLTGNGWKFFKDIEFSDKIASLKNENLVFENLLDIINYHYQGLMYHLKTRGVDLLVTPNHNLYLAKGTYWDGNNYTPPKKRTYPFELASPYKYFGKNKRFKKGVKWVGNDIRNFTLPSYAFKWKDRNRYYTKNFRNFDMRNWLLFLGWYIAEGCAGFKNGGGGVVSIACNNTDGGKEYETIQKVLSNLNFPIHLSMTNRPALLFNLYDVQLVKWLKDNCGENSFEKKVPSFVKHLSPSLIEILLSGLFQGDGYKTLTAYILTTISSKLADDVQELIFKAGYTSRLIMRDRREEEQYGIHSRHPAYEINWLRDSNFHNTSNKGLAKSSIEEWIEYDNQVYCVTVPTNIIYVRRNGIPYWCGNSLRAYPSFGNYEIFDIIDKYEEQSRNVCEICGMKGEMRDLSNWYQTLCDMCFSKRLKELRNRGVDV